MTRETRGRARFEFRTAPEGSTAWGFPTTITAPAVFLEEWIGRTLEEFTAGIGRPADWSESYNFSGRAVTYYYWR